MTMISFGLDIIGLWNKIMLFLREKLEKVYASAIFHFWVLTEKNLRSLIFDVTISSVLTTYEKINFLYLISTVSHLSNLYCLTYRHWLEKRMARHRKIQISKSETAEITLNLRETPEITLNMSETSK